MNSFDALKCLIRLIFFSIKVYFKPNKNKLINKENIYSGSKLANYWANGCLSIMKMRVETFGEVDCKQGALIVSNHQGLFDIFVHASIFNLRFCPKIELKKVPFLGSLISLNFPIWVDRKNKLKSVKIAEDIAWTVNNNMNILIYPEGTNSDGLHGILPFKSTPFEAAIKFNLPVTAIITNYKSSSKNPSALSLYNENLLSAIWRGLKIKEKSASVYMLPPIKPKDGENRKDFAMRIQNIMSEEYQKRREDDTNI